MDRNGWLDRKELPIPSADIQAEEWTYLSGGIPVRGLLVRCKQGARYQPGLVYCRGGIGHFGMANAERLIPFARQGYTVFAPFYRGSGSAGVGRDEFGGTDREDVFSALDLLPELDGISNNHTGIPIVGFSRGAIMALLAARDCLAAGPVVVWGGVSNLLLTYEERVDLRRMLKRVVGHPVKQAAAYHERSAVHWAERIHKPVMIVHGTEDKQVSIAHAIQLHDALSAAGKSVLLHTLEGEGHHLSEAVRDRTVQAIDGWLRMSKGGEIH